MAHEVESMAYVGELPWHNLGFPVTPDLTPRQMCEAAHCDWPVKREPLIIQATGEQLMSHYALTRIVKEKVESLGVCGRQYIPIQNVQAFEFFREFTDAGHMTMETAGSLQGGRYVWALARVDESFRLAGGDEIRSYLLLMSPHIWGKAAIVKFTPTRVVCMNTLQISIGELNQRFRATHSREFSEEVMQEAKKALGLATESFSHIRQNFQLLSETKISDSFTVKFVCELTQKSLLDTVVSKTGSKMKAMLNDSLTVDKTKLSRTSLDVLNWIVASPGAALPSAAGTIFGALNGLTYFMDHKSGRNRDNALTSAWLGPNAAKKRDAYANAVEYALAMRV